MENVIRKIVETEQDSDKIVQRARIEASSIISETETEVAEKIKQIRQEERAKLNALIEEEERSAKEAAERAGLEMKEAFSVPDDESSSLLESLSLRVADRIVQTVFDGNRK